MNNSGPCQARLPRYGETTGVCGVTIIMNWYGPCNDTSIVQILHNDILGLCYFSMGQDPTLLCFFDYSVLLYSQFLFDFFCTFYGYEHLYLYLLNPLKYKIWKHLLFKDNNPWKDPQSTFFKVYSTTYENVRLLFL